MKKQPPFRHNTDIRQDERIAHLIAERGHAGYGVYWMIIEMLHSEENMQIEYSAKKMRRMAAQIGMKYEELTLLLRDMINEYDLFDVIDRNLAAEQAGYLRSTITYRKPRKPKQQAVPTAEQNNEASRLPTANSNGDSNTGDITQHEADTIHTLTPPQQHSSHRAAEAQRHVAMAVPEQHRNGTSTAAFTAAKTNIKKTGKDDDAAIQHDFASAPSLRHPDHNITTSLKQKSHTDYSTALQETILV